MCSFPMGITITNDLNTMYTSQVTVEVEAQLGFEVTVWTEELSLFPTFILYMLLQVSSVLVLLATACAAVDVQVWQHSWII